MKELLYEYFYPISVVLVVAAWCVGQRFHDAATDRESAKTRFPVRRVGLVTVILFCLLSLWLRHRWVAAWHDVSGQRPRPYLIELLFVYHDWLDSNRPAQPGDIKFHGEFFTVCDHLNLLTVALCMLSGAMLGAAYRVTCPTSITNLYNKIVGVYRKAT